MESLDENTSLIKEAQRNTSKLLNKMIENVEHSETSLVANFSTEIKSLNTNSLLLTEEQRNTSKTLNKILENIENSGASMHQNFEDLNNKIEEMENTRLTKQTNLEQKLVELDLKLTNVSTVLEENFPEPPKCSTSSFEYLNGSLSNNAIVGGREVDGVSMHICRTHHNMKIIPGKFIRGYCYVPYAGSEHKYNNTTPIEILQKNLKSSFSWTNGANINIPVNAVRGGYENGITTYVGRCNVTTHNTLVPGKIYQNQPFKLFFPFGGQEHICKNFEILTCDDL